MLEAGAPASELDELLPRILGVDLHVTAPLLRVATGMSAISGLYYAVALVVDPTYRGELVDRLTEQMRETFHARVEYLGLVQQRDAETALD